MKRNRFKKAAGFLCAAALVLTMGVTALADDTISTSETGRSAMWNILTDDQKAQLVKDIKDRLAGDLAEGRITQEYYDTRISAIESGEMPFGRGGRNKTMSNEQKAAWDAMKTKWDSLTDEQKAEIYAICDQKSALESQIIDKYLQFGVIDSETAASMKQNLESKKTDMRTNGRMPLLGGRGARAFNNTVSGS